MKYITDIDQFPFVLEVYECECGGHIGLDSTFLDQVDDIRMECPYCDTPVQIQGGEPNYELSKQPETS